MPIGRWVPALPMDATPTTETHFSEIGVYDARQTSGTFRDAGVLKVEQLEGGALAAYNWMSLRQGPYTHSIHVKKNQLNSC